MTSLMSKSSLYDMVSMIIPGFLFILCVEIASGIGFGNNFDSATSSIITFSLSYILGLIIHLVSKCIFDPILRNEKSAIENVSKETNETIDAEKPLKEYYEKYYYLIRDYPQNIIPILEAQVSFLRSMLIVILSAIFALVVACRANSIPNCCIDACLFVYCILMFGICFMLFAISHCCKKRTNIFTLYGLIFVAAPLLLFLISKDCCKMAYEIFPIGKGCMMLLLILLEIAVFVIMKSRQNDVYKRVFEDYHYIYDINEKENNK